MPRVRRLGDEAVAPARYGHDVALAALAVFERFAQGRDLRLDGVVFHDRAGPDLRDQLVLGDHRAGRSRERAKNVDSTRAEGDTCAVAIEHPSPRIEPNGPNATS